MAKYTASVAGKTVDVLVFNHTSVKSGGEIALLDLLRAGIAGTAHVHIDKEGPLSEALTGIQGVSWSASRSGGGTSEADHLGIAHKFKAVRLRVKTLVNMRRDYRVVLSAVDGPTIYANTLRSALVLCTLRTHGKRIVFHQRDQLTPKYLGRVSSFLSRTLLRARVTHVIANSSSTAATSPLASTRTSVIPSGVADAFYEIENAPTAGPPRMVMLGRLAEWKGQLQFLEALLYLRDELQNAEWSAEIVGGALFGEHEYEEKLRSFIRTHDLLNHVVLRGHVNDVPSVLHDSHILVHASILPEPFGQVVAQGMAAGRPVVAANSGGPLEIIDNNVNGILVDPTRPHELAAALNKLLKDAELRERLAESARLSAERYRVETISKEVARVLSASGRTPNTDISDRVGNNASAEVLRARTPRDGQP